MDEKIVKLKHSIPVSKEGGGTVNVNELSLGRLKAKHLRLLPDNFMENEGKMNPSDIIPLIAGLADIPESAADEIDIEDLMMIAEDMESFLGEFLEAGKK